MTPLDSSMAATTRKLLLALLRSTLPSMRVQRVFYAPSTRSASGLSCASPLLFSSSSCGVLGGMLLAVSSLQFPSFSEPLPPWQVGTLE